MKDEALNEVKHQEQPEGARIGNVNAHVNEMT